MKQQTIRLIFFLFCFPLFPDVNSQSLLWKISGNGCSQPSYLYGTKHITDQRVFE
jgi:uncharacterized protein YbaP (TraB family)